MELITIHNYEAFLLDYSEGTLSKEQVNELVTFLAEHPELKTDLSELTLPSLSKPSVHAEFKNSLKRSSHFVSEELLINYLEGTLSLAEKIEFESNLALNPDWQKELQAFKKTVLSLDETVIFSHKAQLIKNEEDYLLNNPAIAYVENILSGSDRLEFEQSLQTNPLLKREFENVQKTILVPDLTLRFENKAALKKQTKVFYLFEARMVRSMAAAVILLFGLFFVFTTYFKLDQPKTPVVLGSNQQNQPKSDPLLKSSQQNLVQTEMPLTEKKPHPNQNSVQQKINASELNERMPETIAALESTLSSSSQASVDSKTVLEETKNSELVNAIDLQKENSVAISNAIHSEMIKLSSLEEVIDEDEEPSEVNQKNVLWRKAVKLAQRVNNLGLRSINGAESSKEQYVLSFNSFSIEKK